MANDIEELLRTTFEYEASDLHIHAGSPPVIRVSGELKRIGNEMLTKQECRDMIYKLLTDEQKKILEEKHELDIGFGVKDRGRIRMNVYYQRGTICAAMRAIPDKFFSFEELGLPPAINKVVKLNAGLVLVTGPTGSGKSTTLASVINNINENRKAHIVTIEDPIEYLHKHKACLVSQREIGSDTWTFPEALKYSMRQDPDIILIGEMRDHETMASALTIAETGHLIFATLHTPDAPQSINRIIDVFPAHQQGQIRSQLSLSLQYIFCQKLIPRTENNGGGLVLATEVLTMTTAIRNMIREDKTEQMHSAMQSGSESEMQTMNQALARLYKNGDITFQQAMDNSSNKKDMESVMQGTL